MLMSNGTQTILQGQAILVTRPERQQIGLTTEIRSLGGVAVSKPLIRIDQLDSDAAKTKVRTSVQRLAEYDIVIFVSTNAADFGGQWIDNYWPQFPEGLTVIAIGPSTARTVNKILDCEVVQAENGVTSEDILGLTELQVVEGKRIAIFRGAGGRELLASELRNRGATVDYVEVYIREACHYDSDTFVNELRDYSINVLTANSSESVALLKRHLDTHFTNFSTLPLLVPSARVAEQAKQLGFEVVINCKGASDTAFIAALRQLADTILENDT